MSIFDSFSDQKLLLAVRECVQRGEDQIDGSRILVDSDFTCIKKWVHNFNPDPETNFSVAVNEYSPQVFRLLRKMHGVTMSSFLLSWSHPLKNISNYTQTDPGGSSSILSLDGMWLLKQVTHEERKNLQKMLPEYVAYICKNPNSLLPRCIGLFKLKIRPIKACYMIINNVFYDPGNRSIHDTYYIKEAAVMTKKEVDLKPRLQLKKKIKQKLMDQVSADVEFLRLSKVVSYSLLIGVHTMDQSQKLFHSDSITSSDFTDQELGKSSYEHEEVDTLFRNSSDNEKELYFFGICDIFSRLNMRKMFATLFPPSFHGRDFLSVNTQTYADRFKNFLEALIV